MSDPVEALAWLEQTAFSTGVRETPWVFPFILIVHSLGMGLAAGVAVAVGLRALGFASGVPAALFARFLPAFWFGFIANLLSGLVLLAGYPAKALTNPLFYLKLAMLGVGTWLTLRLIRMRPSDPWILHRRASLAWYSLVAWITVIFAGRFLAYTHSVLLASWMV